jgi:hypothetical protein
MASRGTYPRGRADRCSRRPSCSERGAAGPIALNTFRARARGRRGAEWGEAWSAAAYLPGSASCSANPPKRRPACAARPRGSRFARHAARASPCRAARASPRRGRIPGTVSLSAPYGCSIGHAGVGAPRFPRGTEPEVAPAAAALDIVGLRKDDDRKRAPRWPTHRGWRPRRSSLFDDYEPRTSATVALWAAAGRPMTGRPAPSLERVQALIPT